MTPGSSVARAVHPDAAALLARPPAGCVVVQDAPAGVLAGRAAGRGVVAVTTSHPADRLRDAGADAVVASLAQTAPLLLAPAARAAR